MTAKQKIRYSLLKLGAAFCGISVIFGAFGAHWLQNILSENSLNSYETAVTYQMYHGLAFLGISNIDFISVKKLRQIKNSFLIGTLLFCGSIYGIVALKTLLIKPYIIVFLTPIGGFIMVFGWLSLFFSLFIQFKSTGSSNN